VEFVFAETDTLSWLFSLREISFEVKIKNQGERIVLKRIFVEETELLFLCRYFDSCKTDNKKSSSDFMNIFHSKKF